MTKERFLTARWNNLIVLVLGLPTVAYVAVVLSTSILSDGAAFFIFTAIGVLY
jgi:hypothetical protein